LTDDAHLIAALQFIAVNTNNKVANQALTNNSKKLSGISAKDLVIASAEVATILRKVKLDTNTIKTFVQLIQDKLV
jgi:hypothetical protein